jgi:hypothetical protein
MLRSPNRGIEKIVISNLGIEVPGISKEMWTLFREAYDGATRNEDRVDAICSKIGYNFSKVCPPMAG